MTSWSQRVVMRMGVGLGNISIRFHYDMQLDMVLEFGYMIEVFYFPVVKGCMT